MADADSKTDAQVVVLPRPQGPTPPRKSLPTAEEVVAAAAATVTAPAPAPAPSTAIEPAAIVAKAQAAAPRKAAAVAAPKAAPVAPAAAAPASAVVPGRAAFDHHMTIRKGELLAEGTPPNKAHNQALREWQAGERIAPPDALRRAGIRVLDGRPPAPPANVARAEAFRAQLVGMAQLLARCADRRGVPVSMRVLPQTEEGAAWLVITIGDEPGTVMEVQDEVDKAGIAFGALLREWDARHAPAGD